MFVDPDAPKPILNKKETYKFLIIINKYVILLLDKYHILCGLLAHIFFSSSTNTLYLFISNLGFLTKAFSLFSGTFYWSFKEGLKFYIFWLIFWLLFVFNSYLDCLLYILTGWFYTGIVYLDDFWSTFFR